MLAIERLNIILLNGRDRSYDCLKSDLMAVLIKICVMIDLRTFLLKPTSAYYKTTII